MGKERRLGRGLEALLGRVAPKPSDGEAPLEDPTPPPHEIQPEAPPQRAATSEPPFLPQPEATDSHPHIRFDQAHTLEETGHTHSPIPAETSSPPAAAENADANPPPDHPVLQTESVAPVDVNPPNILPPANPTRLEIGQIDSNPYQPRQDFNEAELQSLGESLLTHGLLQPVAVRKVDDRYQIVAGERRYRAAMKVGWTDVPVQVTEADDRQMAEMALVENIQRKDLNALEKAASFQRYLEQYGCTQEELASRLNIDRSTVANIIRLLELPDPVKDAPPPVQDHPGPRPSALTVG